MIALAPVEKRVATQFSFTNFGTAMHALEYSVFSRNIAKTVHTLYRAGFHCPQAFLSWVAV
jgi:hypothetical protein